VKQCRLLLNQDDVFTNVGELEIAEIMAVEPNDTAIGIQQARDQVGNGED